MYKGNKRIRGSGEKQAKLLELIFPVSLGVLIDRNI